MSRPPLTVALLTVLGLCAALIVLAPPTQGAPLNQQGLENRHEASARAPNPAPPATDDINGVLFTSEAQGQRRRRRSSSSARQHEHEQQPIHAPSAPLSSLSSSSSVPPSSSSSSAGKRPFHVDDFGDVITDEGTFMRTHKRERRSATSFGEDLRRYHARKETAAQPGFERQRRNCVSFENSPRAPPADVTKISNPTADRYRRVCKLFVRFSNGIEYVCSGSLVGDNLLATARHCTFSKCYGNAVSTRVACGFSAVSDPYHPGGYAHFGSAYVVSCWRYTAHDVSATCYNGTSNGPPELDIQVCGLDRRLSHVAGHFGTKASAGAGDQPNIVGYPGDAHLNQFISDATLSMLHRYETITDVVYDNRVLELVNVWAWRGESGCPYYFYNTNSNEAHVIGVHRGGPTGCAEYARRWTSDWVGILNDLRGTSTWSKPASHCQVIQLVWDIFNNYDGQLHGVRADHDATTNTYYASTTVTQGGPLGVRGTLYNVGTHSASLTVRVVYSFSSSLSSSTTLWEGTLTLGSEHRYRLTRFQTATMSASSSPYYIGIVWSAPGCKTEDPQYLVAGYIYVRSGSSSDSDEDDDVGTNTGFGDDDDVVGSDNGDGGDGISTVRAEAIAAGVVGGLALVVLVVVGLSCARGRRSASGPPHIEHYHTAAADTGTGYIPDTSHQPATARQSST